MLLQVCETQKLVLIIYIYITNKNFSLIYAQMTLACFTEKNQLIHFLTSPLCPFLGLSQSGITGSNHQLMHFPHHEYLREQWNNMWLSLWWKHHFLAFFQRITIQHHHISLFLFYLKHHIISWKSEYMAKFNIFEDRPCWCWQIIIKHCK